jgi:hypothetical protein
MDVELWLQFRVMRFLLVIPRLTRMSHDSFGELFERRVRVGVVVRK